MQAFDSHTGTAVPLMMANIDTDQIMPKQFLTRIERSGFGQFLFHDWRYNADGSPIEDFVLNQPRYAEASILIAGENFGCGSSREHAPWGILDHGFRAVIAPSFADIFYNNSLKNGLLPVVLDGADVLRLAALVEGDPATRITVDLGACTVKAGDDFERPFKIDDFRRHCLMNGLDDIGLTLQYEADIAAFEASRSQRASA
ncbi:MAG: 3-isopropylmalate dehydratase small subunit [Acidobacteria bacterium OLB17]|nr:MAG: 3-isopropylmalate dehydratase small subunit [Acidobacteria bacterium OLB17]MCZ2390104.1 3-isopropylmalate dehydratase small subunit [Acidobacteriota bacterium]